MDSNDEFNASKQSYSNRFHFAKTIFRAILNMQDFISISHFVMAHYLLVININNDDPLGYYVTC